MSGPAVIYPSGTKQWRLNGLIHREEGPCTLCKDCQSGNFELCSKPGPAIVRADGSKDWYLNGKLHREAGPAIVHPNGRKEWWLNNKIVNKQAVELFYMLKHKKVLDL
jgi:hypothetical protein